MAFCDDRKFLLSHIRHSFITCDDSGICEMALLNEIMPHHLPHDPDSDLLDSYCVEIKSELEPSQSLDIVSDMDMIGAHRRRSNTAQRLEKLKKERRIQSRTRVYQWNAPNVSKVLTEEEQNDLFPVKTVPSTESDGPGDENSGNNDGKKKMEQKKTKLKSALSAQIEKFPGLPNNPFNLYSRFDGRISDSLSFKRIAIFLTMLPPSKIDYPMEVVIISQAMVKDLIGLICWQYTNEGREPKLKPDVNCYCLRIAEENGDVDPDFPSLNPKEPVSKFGFPVLALVEKEDDELSLVVTVHVDEMFSKFEVANLNVTLKWIKDQVFKRRKLDMESASSVDESKYRLEAANDPGVPLDLDTPLSELDVREFKLIRDDDDAEDACKTPGPLEVFEAALPDMFTIKATLYASYTVHAIYKFGRTEVSLGVSGHKIDVNPLPKSSASSKLWSTVPKPVSFLVDDVADFTIKRKPYHDRQTFKIVYKSETGFETLKFQCGVSTFEDIVKQIQYILKMRTSKTRGEYTSRSMKRTMSRPRSSLMKSLP